MASKMAEISVIIPHYNDVVSLDACLTAIGIQTMDPARFEVVVADNMSPIDDAALAKIVAGRAKIVRASEKGAGPARNVGVAASGGTILAFTDCDCVPEPGWLEAGVSALARGDVVGGQMTVSVANERAMTGAEAFERVFAFDNRSYVEQKGFTVTANLFCRRATFDAVGPFRVGVSEDVDWCHRAVAAGNTLVYAEDAGVAHPARADWTQLKRKWARMNAEGFGLAAARPGGRLRWLAKSAAMPASILAHAPRVLASPALPDARARMMALGTLARLRLWRSADSIALGLGLKS